MTDNTQRLQAIFNRANMNRNNIQYKLSRTLYDHVSFMEHKIRKQLKTFTLLSICGGQRASFTVNTYFQNAYNALTLQEKVLEFEKTINYIRRFEEEKENNNVTTQDRQLELIKNKYGSEVRIAIDINTGFRSWEEENITVSGFKIYSDKKINIDLRNYLLRKSKKKQVNCYVLEAIRSSKPQTIRFCFNRKDEQEKNFALINQLINAAYYDFICKESFSFQPGIMKKSSKTGKTTITLQQPKKSNSNRPSKNSQQINQQLNNFQMQDPVTHKHSVSVSYELMRSKDQQQLQQDLKDIIEKQNQNNQLQPYPSSTSFDSRSSKKIKTQKKNFLNIFNIMLPAYNLIELDSLHNFQPIYNDKDQNLLIFRNRINRHKFKMELGLNVPAQKVLMIIYNVEMYKNWHTAVSEGQLKFRISSQNCAIFYQKHSKFSQWYRERDFLYLKHVFTLQGNYYIIDKSFENTNFVPFTTIERGKIHYCVIRIQPTEKGCNIMLQMEIDHGGLLKGQYQEELTLNYLKGFKNIEAYSLRQEFLSKLKVYFYHGWDIQENFGSDSQLLSVENLRTQDFNNSRIANNSLDESQLYFSVDDLDREDELKEEDAKSQHELKEQNIIEHEEHMKEIANLPAKIKVDEKGLIIVPKTYIKKRHLRAPLESNPGKRGEKKFDHILLQDNWKPMETGGLQIINQKKIQAQNNVFGFILKKLKQNIFSGKGLTNISLPVQIFNCDSNLSRICRAFTLAPQFLQLAAKNKDPIERMKLTMIFGVSSSLFFLDAEKPFNPILGETYQGTIDGCPIYAQQISHHPPISCFYMIGRGYKIFGAIEAKVNLHLNSADGVNEGFYHVEYDDGQKISFTGPAGEVSNTTMGGNRQFNFLGKGFYYDAKNKLYSELKFQQETGMFSKGKWKYRDQVEAQIVRVKDSYMSQVVSKIKQNKSPSSKQIEQKYNKLSGRWLHEVKWDDKVYYKTNEDLPFDMMNYEYPLPSDVFYREDIYYRIMEDLARSQIEKERLEVLQRGDRKFREKYHGKAH